MKKLNYLFFYLFLNSSLIQAQWTRVGGDFSKMEAGFMFITISPIGIPYLAYRDGGYWAAGRVNVLNNGTWITVGDSGCSQSDIYDITSVFSNSNQFYVAYMDEDPNQGHKATAMKFTNNKWMPIGSPRFTPGAASYTSIAVDPKDVPYVAFRDVANNYRASVMKFDGSNWVYVGTPGFSPPQANDAGGALYTTLVIDASGTPYIAYANFSNGFKANVLKFDGTNWIYVGKPDFSGGAANYISLAIDSKGIPVVGWGGGKATVMKFDGTDWVPVGNTGFSSNSAEYTSLALDKSDVPYLAFVDDGHGSIPAVMTFNGTSWVSVGNPGFCDSVAEYTSLAIDKNSGILYLAYEEVDNAANYPNYKGMVMKYNLTAGIKPQTLNDFVWNIYPNPANDLLEISICSASPDNICSLRILNSTGQNVYSEELTGVSDSYTKQIITAQLPKGIYIADLLQGKTHSTKKFVIQ